MGQEGSLAHVNWSASAASLYASCPRRFYFRYAASNHDAAADAGETLAVPPPGSKLGTVVHDCIEQQVRRWRDDEQLSLQDAHSSATEQLQAYVEEHCEIIEDRYGENPEEFDRKEFSRSLIRTAHNHLECFFQVIWPQLADHQYILHEITASFEVDGRKVWVRPDLCTRNRDGDFVVTDWKTSSPNRLSSPSVQVLTYALWAHKEFEPDVDRILVQLAHTNQGMFDRTRPEADDISRIRDRILSDLQTWQTAEGVADFEPLPASEKCRGCPYLQDCKPGQDTAETI